MGGRARKDPLQTSQKPDTLVWRELNTGQEDKSCVKNRFSDKVLGVEGFVSCVKIFFRYIRIPDTKR